LDTTNIKYKKLVKYTGFMDYGVCEYCPCEACGETHHTKGTVFLQYTGLKDKNGKEIYEGDIVEQLVWKYVGDNLNLEEDNQFDEVYVKGKVMIYPTKGVVFVENRNVRSLRQKKCEVIGNIYETQNYLLIQGD
jgi:uncharacterized phage protein (TIGR01671 family)